MSPHRHDLGDIRAAVHQQLINDDLVFQGDTLNRIDALGRHPAGHQAKNHVVGAGLFGNLPDGFSGFQAGFIGYGVGRFGHPYP